MVTGAKRPEDFRLIDIRHPAWEDHIEDWNLWRNTYKGGKGFIDTYLERFGKRESDTDFDVRRKVTCLPAFAKSAVNEVKNSIYQRMFDISRKDGPLSYQNAVLGLDGGVDRKSSSMNYFIGQKVLPEMLTMKKVGVYIDMPPTNGMTVRDVKENKKQPYVYLYKAEEILNWVIDYSKEPSEFISLLLQETYNPIDPRFGMPIGTAVRFRHIYINTDGFVEVAFYNDENKLIDEDGNSTEDPTVLTLRQIPFVIFEISDSILADVAMYQVALLNMNSSDINYVLRANFPFYTEQQDIRAESPYLRKGDSENPGEAVAAAVSTPKEIEVGTASGRAYAKGLDRPGFIHPSSEPLKASMEKENQLKLEIRQLVDLAVSNLAPQKQASAESKEFDTQGLEAGLSNIGLELEKGERRIAEFYAMYEGEGKPATVHYPTRYNLKSDDERREETKQYKEILPSLPSKTYQREVGKCLARSVLGHKVSIQTMETIEQEIDKAQIVVVDPDVILQDVTAGMLDKETAAQAKLYPEGVVEKANKEHAERLARIAEHQQKTQSLKAAGSRGVPDASGDPKKDAKEEKQESRDSTTSDVAEDKVRGEGK